MNKKSFLFIASMFLLSLGLCSQQLVRGSLVIVGGGLESTNLSIYDQLIGLASGAEKATFAVIPSASGVSVQSYMSFRNILISYGVKPENIHMINIAMIDDDSTADVNESEWSNNGNDTRLAGIVRSCSAVWFTGGDQLRTLKTLLLPDGTQTPVLKAVWDVYRSGGVIGGTSAGAAIMSEIMIGGGTSLAALNHGVIRNYTGNDFPADSGVLITKGLGFFPHGLVDQHFHNRARIGRLAMALMNEKNQGNFGFGIDENTAIIYNGKQNRMTIAGASGVTILDGASARISYVHDLPLIENLSLSYLEEGDSFDFTTGKLTPAKGKQSTKGKERYSNPYFCEDGVLSPVQTTFRDLITIYLINNRAADSLQNITMMNSDTGFRVTLRKSSSTEGYCTDTTFHHDQYAVSGLMMDIAPVHISVSPLNKQH